MFLFLKIKVHQEVAEEDIPLTEAVTEISEHQLEMALLFERGMRAMEKGDISGFEKAQNAFNAAGQKTTAQLMKAERITGHGISTANTAEEKLNFLRLT